MKLISLLMIVTILITGCALNKGIEKMEKQDNTVVITQKTEDEQVSYDYKLNSSKFLETTIDSDFILSFDLKTGGVMSLLAKNDSPPVNYVLGMKERMMFRTDASNWLGDLYFKVRQVGTSIWNDESTPLSDDIREIRYKRIENETEVITLNYKGESEKEGGLNSLNLIEEWRVESDELIWSFELENISESKLEVGDIRIPMLFNQFWPKEAGNTRDGQDVIYEERIIRHSFLALDSTYYYFQRPMGGNQFLVMLPQPGTAPELFTRDNNGRFGLDAPSWEGLYSLYLHSKGAESSIGENWFYPQTSAVLQPGEKKTYGFTFRMVDGYDEMRDAIYNAGLADVTVAPGMVIPEDLPWKVAIRCKGEIESITADSNKTDIAFVEMRNGYAIYDITFDKPGIQRITVIYNGGKVLPLECKIVESLDSLIKKRASFIIEKQQQNDPEDDFFGSFLLWSKVNNHLMTRSLYPDLPPFFTSSADDLGFANPLYLAEKNIFIPDVKEIESLDKYIEHHIWGNLQRSEDYGIYRWFPIPFDGYETGRSYNYIHLANIYYAMYKIASNYPDLTKLSAEEYLLRAYGTYHFFFTGKMYFDGAGKIGHMGESQVFNIYEALIKEDFNDEADWLKQQLDTKASYLDGFTYPFGSEMYQDSTAFEGVHGYANYYGLEDLSLRNYLANQANRGIQPVWYHYGGDIRFMGDSHYQLSYMTQLGGYALLEYYLNNQKKLKDDELRYIYGSLLASWGLISNSGAASWVYHVESGPNGAFNDADGEIGIGHYGALLGLSSIVIKDTIFGLIGYGCDVSLNNEKYIVYPKDGLGLRYYNLETDLSLCIERDSINKVVSNQDNSHIVIEIAAVDPHEYVVKHMNKLRVGGVSPGTYMLSVNGVTSEIFLEEGINENIMLKIDSETNTIMLKRINK